MAPPTTQPRPEVVQTLHDAERLLEQARSLPWNEPIRTYLEAVLGGIDYTLWSAKQ